MNLPYRFSQTSVARFIPVIERLAAGHLPIIVNPKDIGLNTGTYISRLGDAIAAVLKGHHPVLFNTAMLRSLRKQVRIVAADEMVRIEQRTPAKSSLSSTPLDMDVSTFDLVATLTDQREIDALGLLLNRKVIAGRVKLFGLTTQQAHYMHETYDLVTVPQPDGSFILT